MRRQHVIWPLLAVLTWAVFWPVLRAEFISYDDPWYVALNPYVRQGLTLDGLRWAFTASGAENWGHPLTWLSLMLDTELYGDPGLPTRRVTGGFHATNLVLHTLSVLWLYAALLQMTQAPWRSAAVAALFAVHPLHVESVAWVAERKDVLSTFFAMAALWGYARYAMLPGARTAPPKKKAPQPTRARRGWYAFCFLAFLCSLLSKQMYVTLPFVLLLLDYWPLRRAGWLSSAEPAGFARWKPLILEKLPFFALTAYFCFVAYFSQTGGGAVGDELSLRVRVSNAVVVYALYLWKTVWPAGLAVYYPHPGDGISNTSIAAAAACLAIITVVAIWKRRQQPYLIVGWLWYLGTLVPVIGIVQIGTQRMADRYTYFPLVGTFLASVWCAASVWPRRAWQRAVAAAAALTILGGLAFAAHRQAELWHDSITLFQHAVDVTGGSHVAHSNLGKAMMAKLGERGNAEVALQHLKLALGFNPYSGVMHDNLARALQQVGRSDEARQHYEIALKLMPDAPTIHNHLGTLLEAQGQRDQAISQYETAVHIAPTYAAAHRNLGRALHFRGDHGEALRHFNECLKLNPNDVEARVELGSMFVSLGRPREGIEQYAAALARGFETAEVRQKLGMAYLALGDSQRAAVEFQKAKSAASAAPGSSAGLEWQERARAGW